MREDKKKREVARQDKTKKKKSIQKSVVEGDGVRGMRISACIDSALGQCVQTHTHTKPKQADYKIMYSPSHKHNVLCQVVVLHLQFNEMT